MKTLEWQDYRLEWKRTLVMGVLNITPDSFSDGGCFSRHEDAVSHGLEMAADGADIIDIGGESTRPFSRKISAEEEIRRVIPVISELAGRIDIPISIDTAKAEVAEAAMEAGASIINDISALRFDPETGKIAARFGVPLILMHMKGTPETMQQAPEYEDLTGEINFFFEEAVQRAVSCGVPRERLLLDPGIGFGKTVHHNLLIIKNLAEFNRFGLPIVIGTSRKAFIRKTLKKGDEDPDPRSLEVETGTQASISAAVLNGAHIIRVHDVKSTFSTIGIIDAIRNA